MNFQKSSSKRSRSSRREPDESCSDCDILAYKIRKCRKERVNIVWSAHIRFTHMCKNIAEEHGYEKITTIKMNDLKQLQRHFSEHRKERGFCSRFFHSCCGVILDDLCLAEVLDKAMEEAVRLNLADNDWFHYGVFSAFHTREVSRWPWRRHRLLNAFAVIILYYFFTVILFCGILNDLAICQDHPKTPGWVSALYFASTTMSTVGKPVPSFLMSASRQSPMP